MKAKLVSLALLLTVTAGYAELDCEQEPYKSNPDFQKTCQELQDSIQEAKKENLQRFSKQLENRRSLLRPPVQPGTGTNPLSPPATSTPAPTPPTSTHYPQPAPAPAEPAVAPPAPAKPTNRIYY